MAESLFFRLLRLFTPAQLVLLLALGLFLTQCRAEGVQVSGYPGPACPMGMVWAQVSLGAYGAVYFCAPADILERKEVQIQIEGRQAVNCRVLAVRGK